MDKKEIQRKFGMNVKAYRYLSKKSQEELAFLAGISTVYMSALERGEKCPTIDTVFKIAEALQILPTELLDFERKEVSENNIFSIIQSSFEKVPNSKKIKMARVFESLVDLYCDD